MPTATFNIVRRRAEVDAKDHEEFQGYLAEKKEADARKKAAAAPTKSRGVSRRTMFNVAVGTAVAAEAGVLGYNALSGGSVSDHGIRHAGANYTEAQRHNIVREVVDNRADIRGQSLGNWVALLPTKMGGGTYAIDLNSNRVLGSIWYWNYGDYNPISHHLCAFPSADPLHGFEFVNSTQGGQNSLIYGMNTAVTAETAPEGTNIYRVRYNGTQMELIENVSESTGLGLGVHVTVNPKDAQSYFVTDGQKDIAACFDRTTSKVKAGLRFDWTPNVADLREAWIKGGTLTIKQHLSRSEDRPVRLQGHQGQQDRLGNGADGRAVRRGGLAARRRPVVADRRRRHDLASRGPLGGHRRAAVRRHRHPRSREELRAGGLPAVQQGLAGPVSGQKLDKDTWKVVFDKIHSPGHEIGFSPDGKFLVMMNNLRENNCSIFNCADPDPRNWRKVAHVEDPLWRGKYPNPFHMVFSIDSSKLYLTILHPSPAFSGIMVVDTKTWTIIKEIQGIGPDLQTPALTYDGKYLITPFSGFQRQQSGISVIDTSTDTLIGILPSNGGHHDCVIIPTKLEHMKHTRSCTL